MTLRDAIAARLDNLEQITQDAIDVWGDGTWQGRIGGEGWEVYPCSVPGHVILASTEETVIYIVNMEPAHGLRGLVEDYGILTRHVESDELPMWPPGVPEESRRPLCAGCHGKCYADECPEIRSLARRHGIEVPA